MDNIGWTELGKCILSHTEIEDKSLKKLCTN